jgi:hypothetical protein
MRRNQITRRPQKLRRRVLAGAALAGALLASPSAEATFTVTFSEQGNNVVAIGTGSIDTADLTFNSSGGIAEFVAPQYPSVLLGPPNTFPPVNIFTVAQFNGPGPIGSGGESFVSSGSGDEVGFAPGLLVLPAGYQSGARLSDEDVWANATFASLGLTVGSYFATFGSGAGEDSLQIYVGTTPVPEPGSGWLMGGGLAVLGLAWAAKGRKKVRS